MKRKSQPYRQPSQIDSEMKDERLCLLMKELSVIADQMAYAMTQANLEHIARTGSMTPRMVEILNQYYAFATRASQEGL